MLNRVLDALAVMFNKKIAKKIKKIFNSFKLSYLRALSLAVDEKLVLVEGGQGININGNMFSMLRELKTNPRWSDYRVAMVVTDDTIKKAQERMSFYGFDDVILAVRDSKEYCRLLATAKYVMTDNSFPPYFNKRKEQVMLNTWHGTPLKALGMSDKSNLASPANIQKNYLMSDYALFPNEFTKDVFMSDYHLKNIFNGEYLIANYPRNYVFYDAQQGIDMKSTLGLDGKQVFAYMPTWRGTGRTADVSGQLKVTMRILKNLDKSLRDDQVVLLNLHFMLASEIDCNSFKHIKSFPSQYDTYEVLNACDGLITDYSSVFFDFAVSRKKIILFAYDKENYLSSRGIYIPFDELPFPIVENVKDLVAEMDKDVEVSESFIEEYCPNGSVDSCERIFDMMVNGKTESYELKRVSSDKPVCLVFTGNLLVKRLDALNEYMALDDSYNYVIAYRGNLNKVKKEYINSLDPSIVTTFGTVTAYQFKIKELLAILFRRYNGKTCNEFFTRELQRTYHKIAPAKVVDYCCTNVLVSGMLSKLDCKKEYVEHSDYLKQRGINSKKTARIKAFEKKHGFECFDFSQRELELHLEKNEGIADNNYCKFSPFMNLLPLYFNFAKRMICISLFLFKTPEKVAIRDTWLTVGDREYKAHFLCNKVIKSKLHFGIYSFNVPILDTTTMPTTNKVVVNYTNMYGERVMSHVFFVRGLINRFLGLRGVIARDEETKTTSVFRQSRGNRLNIYVRSANVTDKLSHRIMQIIAYIVAIFWRSKKAKKLVLLYEKDASKYEESASVLFENLIDHGYDNAYFIVDRNYPHLDNVDKKYFSNIIYKYTFKHYLYFFKSRTFIGTETLIHSIDLKTFNVLPLKKITDKNLNYVFLQHGVMYMVSLDSESRTMFKRKNLNGKYKVVVSSQLEANHFTELGRHLSTDLYITGLPKFDRNIMLPDADKIVIMPTWRPWEINMARENFIETPYFKMTMKIFNSIPEELKDKVVILPHPLIVNELKQLPEAVSSKIVVNAKYDDILKQARVLITDYSSIAYDAFYRGARVIFYWEEKDYCMSQYGPTTKLMLNEDNVYGDYFYSDEGLTDGIRENYRNPQKTEHVERYSHIVQFHDGKNTERLIQALGDDDII